MFPTRQPAAMIPHISRCPVLSCTNKAALGWKPDILFSSVQHTIPAVRTSHDDLPASHPHLREAHGDGDKHTS